jgi:hypothetical protein
MKEDGTRGLVAWMLAKINEYKILVGKPEWHKPPIRSMLIWKDDIKVCLTETGEQGVNRIRVVRDKDEWQGLVSSFKKLQVH